MINTLRKIFNLGQAGGAAHTIGPEGRTINYFVGHKPPEFELWPNFHYYSPSSSSIHHELPDPRLGEGWRFSEYASLFLLRREIHPRTLQHNETVTIAQYRRFTLTKNVGVGAEGLEWTRIIRPTSPLISDLYKLTEPSAGLSVLIPPAVKFHDQCGILKQYASAHPIRDLLRFSACLVDNGILSNQQAEEFLLQNHLIPAPSCSTLPVDLFLYLYEVLEQAALSYLQDGYIDHNAPYQGRVCAFLLERLHSYLLMGHLKEQHITTNKVFGYLTVISEDLKLKSSTTMATLIDISLKSADQ